MDFLDLRAEDVEKYIYMTPEGRISDASGPLAVRSLATKFGVMHFGRGKFFGDLPRPQSGGGAEEARRLFWNDPSVHQLGMT